MFGLQMQLKAFKHRSIDAQEYDKHASTNQPTTKASNHHFPLTGKMYYVNYSRKTDDE